MKVATGCRLLAAGELSLVLTHGVTYASERVWIWVTLLQAAGLGLGCWESRDAFVRPAAFLYRH